MFEANEQSQLHDDEVGTENDNEEIIDLTLMKMSIYYLVMPKFPIWYGTSLRNIMKRKVGEGHIRN